MVGLPAAASALVFVAPLAWFTPAAPAMLYGLTLAGLPILIHLLHRRRFKETKWAAMEWLLEAVRKRSRLLNLEQLLLLAVRTLLVMLVVLAMAKPALNAVGAAGFLPGLANPVVHTVVVFDNSLSMQYRSGNTSSWDRAKKAVQTVLESGGVGDLASVVVMGSPPRTLVREASNNLLEVAKEIDGIKPHHGSARIEPAIDAVAAILKQSRAVRKRVLFVTDMQRHLWETGTSKEGSTTTAASMAKRIESLADTGREFIAFDVGDEERPNSAVLRVEALQSAVLVKQPAVFRASLAHFGTTAKENVLVEILVDGQVEASERVTLPAGGKPTMASFSHVFRDAGEKLIEVRIADDSLKADNRRGLGVRVQSALQVLLVDGQPSGEPFRSETDYLKIALTPDETSPITTSVRMESDLLESRLDDWDAILLCNVGSVTAGEAARLHEYLKRGGGVAFFLGSQVNIDAYNQGLYADGAGLLPVQLVETVGSNASSAKPILFDHLGYKHPLTSAFAGNENAGLLTAKTFAYTKMKPHVDAKNTGARVEIALGFQGGDPAVVFAAKENGRVAVVATSVDLDWNRWAISPSFLPIMQNIVRDLTASRFHRPMGVVGEPLTVVLPKTGFEVPTSLVAPDGMETKLPLDEKAGVATTTISELETTGAYSLKFGAPINAVWPLAVNSPNAESDLARISAAEIKTNFPGIEIAVVKDWADRPRSSEALRVDDASLHRLLLWLALVLAFVETALAWRCGHH